VTSTTAEPDAGEDLDVLSPRRSHRRAWIVVAVATVIVGVGALWFGQRWIDRGPDAASVDDAVDRFRSSSVATRPPEALRPAAGVYQFAGSGDEHLSFLSTSQSQGPELPGTITHDDDGCWTFEIEYNSFHRQSWRWCAEGGRLVERGGVTHQQFDFAAFKVDETSDIVCDPPFVAFDPAADVGSLTTTECRGSSTTTDTDLTTVGTYLLVGRESLNVGGTAVPALHYRARRTISGDQTGEEQVDMWFARRDGMPLRNVREVTAVSPAPAPLDSVTYTERGEWELVSLTPQQ
jgi:hypothetical protein